MAASNAKDRPTRHDECLTVADQMSLAVRAGRRAAGLSQRSLAAALGWSAAKVERLELDAGAQSLRDVVRALENAGFELVVVRSGVPVEDWQWDVTDLVARDRAGRRFPAHRFVRATPAGPFWWWDQEVLRLSRPLGPRPRWTAEGSAARQVIALLRSRPVGPPGPPPAAAPPTPAPTT